MTIAPTTNSGFEDPAKHQVELGERTPFDKMVALGSIDSKKPKPILLNVESGIKDIISALAKNEKIDGVDIDPEEFAKLPNSQTGVVVYFIAKGLREQFNISFDAAPTSLKIKGLANKFDKKVEGKKRLLTRDEKNDIIAKLQMSYYEKDMATGKMSMDDVMSNMKEAFNTKKEFEDMGYMLPQKKTEYPYWVEEKAATD